MLDRGQAKTAGSCIGQRGWGWGLDGCWDAGDLECFSTGVEAGGREGLWVEGCGGQCLMFALLSFLPSPEAQCKPYYSDYSRFRLLVHHLCTSHYLDLFITGVIGLNVVTMAMEHYQQPQVRTRDGPAASEPS